MKRKYLLKSSINIARFTRLIAKLVDLFIVLILSVILYPFGLLLAISYLAVADSLQEGRSVGKKLMGFSVISLIDGKPCTLKQSIIRNLPLLIPLVFALIPIWGWIFCSILTVPLVLLETYLLFKLDSGHRLGDVMADTTVIANDPESALIGKKTSQWFSSDKNMSACKTQN